MWYNTQSKRFLILISIKNYQYREDFVMNDKKSIKSSKPTSQQKKRKKRRNSSNCGAPMVATGDRGIPYTYPTGNSEDY